MRTCFSRFFKSLASLALLLAFVSTPALAAGGHPDQPADPQAIADSWSAVGAGLTGTVNAVVLYKGDLYVGGSFLNASGNPAADHLVYWDGSLWQPVGGGLTSDVNTLLVVGDNLYVGGFFYNAGGLANADGIAVWNGASWSALGTGTSGRVNALVAYGGEVYAGGEFTAMGGVAGADNLARWNGSGWQAFSLGDRVNNLVSALMVDGPYLYAGGLFTQAGNTAGTNRIARWNGDNWEALGTGINPGNSGGVLTVVAAGPHIYAGGSFTGANGAANLNYLARWNGSAWETVGSSSALNAMVCSLRIIGPDLFVAGKFTNAGANLLADYIVRWDSASWQAVGGGLGAGGVSYDAALLVVGSDLYVGGNFTNAGGDPGADYLARWVGHELSPGWNAVGTGLNGTVQVILPVGHDLYLGGSFTDAGGDPNADRVARWDGHAYHAVGTGIGGGTVNALAMKGSLLYVGGNFTNAGGNAAADYITCWDGNSWEPLGGGLNGAVNALLFFGPTLLVGGDFTDAGSVAFADRVAIWDGASWGALDKGFNDTVFALVQYDLKVVAGGQFVDASNIAAADYLATWDGSIWLPVGGSALVSGGWVNALAVSADKLFMGGNFTAINSDTSLARLAYFDGATWTGSGLENGFVAALATAGNSVAAAGSFSQQIGFVVTKNIILWKNYTWNIYSVGLNGVTNSVAIVGSNVYAGGYFTGAGSRPLADHIARWGTKDTLNFLPVIRK